MSMVLERLKAYQNFTNRLPDHIIVYRYGVTESQCSDLQAKEIVDIEKAYTRAQEIGPICQVKITYITVNQCREMVNEQGQVSNSGKTNAQPRKIFRPSFVANAVTAHPRETDFSLLPHKTIKGTAPPFYYVVRRNDLALSMSKLQEMVRSR